MIRFRSTPSTAIRDEYIVEASVSEAGNDAALIAVFNSCIAAEEFANFLNFLAEFYQRQKEFQAYCKEHPTFCG